MAFAQLLLALGVAFCGGALATGGGLDTVALHQGMIRIRSNEPSKPQAIAPSKSEASKMRPLIRETADGMLKRATSALKLPTIPAVFRWELVGKVTQWAMERYQRPKQPAVLELVDGAIGLASDTFGSKDIATMADEELVARLTNATRVHALVQRYLGETGAPPSVVKLADAVAVSVEKKGSLDAEEARKMLVDAANETSGPALAELVAYAQDVAAGRTKQDEARSLQLSVPVLIQFGAPPAVADFLYETANMSRAKRTESQDQEARRFMNMLTLSAEQLHMPPAFPEILGYLATVLGNSSNSHIFEKPQEVAQMLVHVNGLFVKINDQLGGPAAVSQLIARLAAPLRNESAMEPAEFVSLLAQASKQVGMPSAVTEFLEYAGPAAVHNSQVDPEHLSELLIKLTSELDAPEAVAKFGRDASALVKKAGGKPDPAKMVRLATQLLRKLSMPAVADVFSHIAGPVLIKGKAPDALALAAAGPSLMKVLPDLETGNSILSGMRAKLMQPLLLAHEAAVERLTAGMPETAAKHALKSLLTRAGPHF